jgi:hypothetical protein
MPRHRLVTMYPVQRQPAPGRPLGPAALQLLGWIGFLGLGYVAVGRRKLGFSMLVGWWAVALVLFAFSAMTLFVGSALQLIVWVIVPPLSSLLLYFDSIPAGASPHLRGAKISASSSATANRDPHVTQNRRARLACGHVVRIPAGRPAREGQLANCPLCPAGARPQEILSLYI